MRAARGAAVAWKEQARCRPSSSDVGLPRFAWTVDPKDTGKHLLGRPAKAWVALAVLECRNCPVQYDCARFALQVNEKWGTWSMHIDDLKRLQAHPRQNAIIAAAELAGIPVQVAVRRALD